MPEHRTNGVNHPHVARRRANPVGTKAIDEFRPPPRSLPHDDRDVAGEHHHRCAGRGGVCCPGRPREPPGHRRHGWVSEALDTAPLTGSGQMFRMAMYHANHPNGSYEMTNRVAVFDPPRAISWQPGQDIAGDGKPQFGGWTWRNDLVAAEPSGTEVMLTYDWTAVPPFPTRAHHVPAVPRGPPHQLAAPPGRAGPTGRRRRHFGSRSQSTWGIAARWAN